MYPNDCFIILQYVVCLAASLFFSGVVIKRLEKAVSEFSYALREKYKRTYVKQNKIIKFIRGIYKMDTSLSIHWMHCVFHYLQLVAVFLSASLFVLFLIIYSRVSFQTAMLICIGISVGHFGIIAIFGRILLCVEIFKCNKIKKENPKYAKCDFYQSF